MWEALLAFFADLILFTFGLGVSLAWIAFIIVILIEAYDFVMDARKYRKQETELNEEYSYDA